MKDGNQSMVVASFAKNNSEAICFGVSQYNGKDLIFIRSFTSAIDGDGLIPTMKGISLGVEKWPELFKAIKDIENVMSSEKIIATIPKNNSQEIRVVLSVFKDNPLINIRTFTKFKGETEYKPTPQGVSVRTESYGQLLESAEKLDEALNITGQK